MTLVDSSVWIDYFRGLIIRETDRLDALLKGEPLATGDLILTEVLQGFGKSKDFDQAMQLLTSLVIVNLAGEDRPSRRQETSYNCVHWE